MAVGRKQGGLVMDRQSVENLVKEIVIEQLGVGSDQVTPKAKFVEDLGADSLDAVELVIAFEDNFGIEILDADLDRLMTVSEVIEYIIEKVA
jgi:acyl carrier protein